MTNFYETRQNSTPSGNRRPSGIAGQSHCRGRRRLLLPHAHHRWTVVLLQR